jgi:hypothetical protein
MEQLLKELYYNPLTGMQSADKLYKKAKSINNNITLKLVNNFLKGEASAQITKEVKRNKNFNTIISPSLRNNYQMDIMYLPNPSLNKNYKYLLTCIDVYSRYIFVEPLKLKSGEVIFEAIKKLFSENGKPVNLNLDLGKEFIYNPFKKYCDDNNITLWYSDTEQENKNAIIERLHRTIRNMILKYEVSTNHSYIDVLQDLIKNYNTTYHNTIKNTPLDIWKGKDKNKQSHKIIIHTIKEGDNVRHLVKKKIFDKKSSTATYTKKIYTVSKVDGNSYYLDDLTKPFKEHELIIAVGDNLENNNDLAIIEENKQKTIKRRLKKEGLE